MIKVYINNEEVLCDKNIVIKKEMLNTSSTILNNVYPKSWETTHDYTTNYYYPLDYSNCKITDIRETPAEEGQIIEGTDFNINVDLSKEYSFDDFKGNTTQDGTPTPDAPVEVETVTGIQKINVVGKNILYYEDGTTTWDGAEINTKGNTITYTPNTSGQGRMARETYKQDIFIPAGSTLTFSQRYVSGSTWASGVLTNEIRLVKKDGTYLGKTFGDIWPSNYQNTKKVTFTTEEDYIGIKCYLMMYGITGMTTPLVYNVQLEYSPYITDFAPYQSQSYEINLGDIELCKIGDYQDRIYKDSGKWYIEKKIGKIESYNGETITTDYISTTGQLTTGAIVYYVLATPTTTEITDTELINQLESIELIEGTNNISSNGNLPIIMNLHYNYVTHRIDTTLLFSGIVKNTGNISLNPREPHYTSIEVLGYETFLSESDTLDFVIADKTIQEAIEMVIEAVSSYGIVLGNVNIKNPNDIIGAYSCEDKTAYDVLQYLAEISEARWKTTIVDEDTIQVDFYDPDLESSSATIEYTQRYFASNNIIDMEYNYGTRDYRNKQVINSNAVYADILTTETIYSDGYNTSYNLENRVGTISSVTINGVEATYVTKEEYDNGYSGDLIYEYGSNTITLETLQTAATPVVINYTAIVKGRETVTNDTEISRINSQLNVNGIISRYEDRDDITSSDELLKIANTYMKYKGATEITLTIQNRDKDLFDIGQVVTFDNAPLEELQTTYIVKAKEIDYIVTANCLFYTYTLTSNFNSENAINYFDNQRNKRNGNIATGSFIDRNIDMFSSANIIWQNASLEEVEVVGDNRLNSTLNSPFVV